MTEPYQFQPGDMVRVWGFGTTKDNKPHYYDGEQGRVLLVDSLHVVVHDDGEDMFFHPHQCELIERAKKTVKKIMYAPVLVYEFKASLEAHVGNLYDTKEGARKYSAQGGATVGCLPLEIELEEK